MKISQYYYQIFALILFFPTYLEGQSDNYGFNLNDILDENLMPASLFATNETPFFGKNLNLSRDEFYGSSKGGKNFSSAFSTMKYHRKMMNEYMASGFLSKQILSELAITPSHTLEKRLGKVSNESTSDNENEKNHRSENSVRQEKMLYDEGSSGYKNWLEKTTTLEDIHRQLLEPKKRKKKLKGSRLRNPFESSFIRRQGYEDEDFEDEEDYDEGDITGYAINEPMINPYQEMSFGVASRSHHPQISGVVPTGISKVGYNYQPTGHDTYEDYGVQQVENQTKELNLKDIMEIALTTLAFLSFGMFILQVLMCITMNKEDNSMMMMMPMETETVNTDGTEEIRRRKRRSPESIRLKKINELSKRILISIETVMRINEDDGKCYYRYLCENNKFARNQKDGQKIWIPIWSLGISWLSNRMKSPKTQTNTVLNSLRACAIGLGSGNCKEIYTDCNEYNVSI